MQDRTYNGTPFRILNIMDECTRECLVTCVAWRLRSKDVWAALNALFVSRGFPTHIRSDNEPEFTAKRLRQWLARLKVGPLW